MHLVFQHCKSAHLLHDIKRFHSPKEMHKKTCQALWIECPYSSYVDGVSA